VAFSPKFCRVSVAPKDVSVVEEGLAFCAC